MKKAVFAILVCAIAVNSFAQDVFVVYSTVGEITLQGKKKPTFLSAGNTIPLNGSIVLPKDAGITLIGKEGAFFSITEPGTHSLSKFSDSSRKSHSSVLNNFMKYLWELPTKKRLREPGRNRKNYMDEMAPITRDMFNIWISPSFDTLNYSGIGGKFGLCWVPFAKVKEFEFSLYAASNIDTPFYKTYVREQKMPMTDLEPYIKTGNSYYWTSTFRDEEDDFLFVLNYVTKVRYDSVISVFDKQKPLIESAAEEAFRTAFMLENAHYLAEAYEYYSKAVNLASSNQLYNSTLKSFEREFELNK